jgi:hypothetical protein
MPLDPLLIGIVLISLGIVAQAFLSYTLVHLQELEISATHPRVIVETILTVVLLGAGLYYLVMEL